MGGQEKKTADGAPGGSKRPERSRVAPITEYGCFEDYVAEAEALYGKCREAFLASDVSAPEFPEISGKWALAARQLIETAGTLFSKNPDSDEEQRRALEILERCKKDSGVRAKNLSLHYRLAEESGAEEGEKLDKLFRALMEGLHFHMRAESTQQAYLRRYIEGPGYEDPEYRAEKKWSAVTAEKEAEVPRGHMFLPARPFPPRRTPEGEDVPWPPDAFVAWKNLPAEDFVYDKEHDEFALPEGYVSADGRIDDESVEWDWEKRTVRIKYRGEEAETWAFWKAADTRDVPDGWVAEYYIRLYQQTLRDLGPPGLEA